MSIAIVVAGTVAAGGADAVGNTVVDGACRGSDGVTVVVDFADLGGGVVVGCATGRITSGFDALGAAGFDYTTALRSPGFLCRIGGRPANDPCINPSPASAYWSYWLVPSGGGWCYSNLGAGNRVPPAGSVEGWSFSTARSAAGSKPPRIAPPGSRVGGGATADVGDNCDTSHSSTTTGTIPSAGSATPTPTTSHPNPAPGPATGGSQPMAGPARSPSKAPASDPSTAATSSTAPTAVGRVPQTVGGDAPGRDGATPGAGLAADVTGDGPNVGADGPGTATVDTDRDAPGEADRGATGTGGSRGGAVDGDGIEIASIEAMTVRGTDAEPVAGSAAGVLVTVVILAAVGIMSLLVTRSRSRSVAQWTHGTPGVGPGEPDQR